MGKKREPILEFKASIFKINLLNAKAHWEVKGLGLSVGKLAIQSHHRCIGLGSKHRW